MAKKKDWLMEAVCATKFTAVFFWIFFGALSYLAILFLLSGSWIMGLLAAYAAVGFNPSLRVNPLIRLSMWGSYFVTHTIWFNQ
jgi:hypothetical protein